MPLYEYECGYCGSIFEVFSHKYEPVNQLPYVCNRCLEGGRLKLKISGNTFQLKGTGWEKDGYA